MALEDIAGYSLRRGLGSGATGSVWLLRDLGSGRHAVLKRIRAATIPAVEEFRRDLILTRSIDNPHIARLLDVRQTDREWLLFSQYVAAGTLANLLERREPLSTGELVTLISPLAQALAVIHRAGLVHGNLSPANVMLDAEGRPVLTDVGLRSLTTPSPTPESDLAALAEIALAAGGDPRIFSRALFTGDADQVAERVLRLALPAPITLLGSPLPNSASPAVDPATTYDLGAPAATGDSSAADSGGGDGDPSAASSASGGSGGSGGGSASGAGVLNGNRPPARRKRPKAGRPDQGREPLGPLDADAESTGSTEHSSAGAGNSPTTPAGAGTGGRRNRKSTVRRLPKGRSGRARRGVRPRLVDRLRGRAPAYGVLAAAGAAAVVVLVLGLVTVGALGGGPSIAASTGESAATGPQLPTATAVSTAPEADWPTPWLQVLRALDLRRSSAFRKVDDAELDAVYIRGSVPWKADKELLATYRNQRLRIEGLTMEIRSLSIELEDTNHAILQVVDRLAAGTAVDQADRRTTLPPGKPTSRRITLEAPTPGTWRISGITTL